MDEWRRGADLDRARRVLEYAVLHDRTRRVLVEVLEAGVDRPVLEDDRAPVISTARRLEERKRDRRLLGAAGDQLAFDDDRELSGELDRDAGLDRQRRAGRDGYVAQDGVRAVGSGPYRTAGLLLVYFAGTAGHEKTNEPNRRFEGTHPSDRVANGTAKGNGRSACGLGSAPYWQPNAWAPRLATRIGS